MNSLKSGFLRNDNGSLATCRAILVCSVKFVSGEVARSVANDVSRQFLGETLGSIYLPKIFVATVEVDV